MRKFEKSIYILVILNIILFGLFIPNISEGQSSTATTYRIRRGTSLPSICNPNGDNVFYKTDTGILYLCTATNTWTAATSSGSAISGSGVANRIAFWNGTSSLTSDGNLTFSGSTLTTGSLSLTTPLSSSNGGVAAVDTIDQGIWCPVAMGIYALAPGATTIVASNNQVRVIQTILPYRTTIARATIEITTAGAAASTVTLGIYSANGNTKLLETGTFNGNSATIQTVTFTPLTLNPGVYFYVWSASDATIQARTLSGNTQWVAIVYNNQTVKKVGTAANSTVAGVLPTTLGTISGVSINAPVTALER